MRSRLHRAVGRCVEVIPAPSAAERNGVLLRCGAADRSYSCSRYLGRSVSSNLCQAARAR